MVSDDDPANPKGSIKGHITLGSKRYKLDEEPAFKRLLDLMEAGEIDPGRVHKYLEEKEREHGGN